MEEQANKLVGEFHALRESCQHYHGVKENDEMQCTHVNALSDWCAFRDCPYINEAISFHGLD